MEFDDIVVKEIPGLCRCCLSEGCYKDMGTEYTWMSDNEVYADMLLECFDIGISQHNEGPNGPNRLICEVCITRLRDACNFKKQVVDSEKKFIDMMGRGEFRHKVLIYQSQMKAEVNEEVEDTEVEYLEDMGEYVDEDDLPLKSEVQEPSVSEVAAEPLRTKRGRPRKNAEKPEKKRKVEERPKSSKAVVKGYKSKSRSSEFTVTRRRNNLKILLHNTSALPFRWKNLFICFYCGKHTTEVSEIRNHTQSHGKCTLMEHSFRQMKSSQVDLKLDVSDLTCKLCNVVFLSLDDIIDHLIKEHDLNYDKTVCMYMQQYYLSKSKCPECNQSFVYSSFLINHVEESHPIISFPCERCHDDFSSAEYYQEHWDLMHSDSKESDPATEEIVTLLKMSNALIFKYKQKPKCFFCDELFDNFAILREHMRTTHENPNYSKVKSSNNVKLILNDLACKYCVDNFGDLEDLAQHLREEHNAEIDEASLQYVQRFKIDDTVENYTCYMCKEQVRNFVLLLKHVKDNHTVPLCPPVLCPKCGMTFKTPITFNQHFERTHSNAIECATCGKEFSTRSKLISHEEKTHDVDMRVNLPAEKIKTSKARKKRKTRRW